MNDNRSFYNKIDVIKNMLDELTDEYDSEITRLFKELKKLQEELEELEELQK